MRWIYSIRPMFGLSLVTLVTLLIHTIPAAAQECEPPVGTVASVQGTVEALRKGRNQWQPLRLNDILCPADTVRVGENSRADLALAGQSVLRLDAGTEMTLEGVSEDRTFLLDVFRGAAHFFSRQPRGLEVQTPYTIAGVRGTEFLVRIEADQTFLSVYEGVVLARNDAGSLTLQGGQSAVAEKGKAPVLRVVVKPRDAVHWALYYPPVLYDVPPDLLERAPETLRSPEQLAQQAALLLEVGRVEEAMAALDRALALAPGYSPAYALRAIVAVTHNEKEQALELARKAVSLDPDSATARIALSYAHQALFDLVAARKALLDAVNVAPENALAWARLSEIQTSFSDLDDALASARRAKGLAPNLSRTQMVLGFAYLMQVKTEEAKEAFVKAIEFDQAAPLPRLGLGLAKIREGDLEEGRREIEIAASLNPNSSIIRSYLGKAYYEEKRTDLDDRQFNIAKELDPSDPTPYFYDAINLQTQNRPVEALRNYERAVDLNENRAVYRSSLQLDSDLAARSAAVAQIYNNLGFGQLGLLESYNAVNTDPTNFFAHRFLADTYSTLPRHQIARVSELLQSQLLQPLNTTPIQPSLAESNLFLISSLGPTQLSFSEFNNLMITRNRAAFLGSGFVGTNDTWAGEGILSGIYDNFSVSTGYNRFETDGFRINNDQEDEIATIFAQLELTNKTSVQAEYRYRDSERGYLQLRFDQDDFLPDHRENEETDSWRLGLRHDFSPGNIVLANLTYQEKNFLQQSRPGAVFGPFGPSIELNEIKDEVEAIGGEFQYLFKSTYFNLVTGAGFFEIDMPRNTTQVISYPPPPIGAGGTEKTVIPSDLSAEHTNIYLYSYLYYPINFIWTFGISGDFYDSPSNERSDENQVNPKFGITWTPIPGTTFRGTIYRALKRTLITDQTLEPTQISGFNQFFDDADGTESWRYGAAVDQKLNHHLYAGLEYSERDLTVPFLRSGSPPGEVDWSEKLFRAYLYWAPHKMVALTADYLYEEFDRDPRFSDGAFSVETHSIPLGINLHHPAGVSAFLKGTYVNQEGKFERIVMPGDITAGQDDFWLVDASVRYRFPKRNGFLTLGITNLFDKQFHFFDIDRDNTRVQPERTVFAQFTLAFP